MSGNMAIFLDGTVPCLGLETLPRDPYNITSLPPGNHFRVSIAMWEKNFNVPISFQLTSLMAESIFPAVGHILKIVIYSWKCYTGYTNNGSDEPTFLAEKLSEFLNTVASAARVIRGAPTFSSQLGLHAACACFVLAAKVAEMRETGKTGGIWDYACSKNRMRIVFAGGNIEL
ncbi:hypothetical protein BOTCAL_0098g00110 [Botryotinia calthae]|uniref:Uncharacterized protein n=1 Tax=Botryotinia calthae TaxID=38488 RepID=A0A4Y8D6U5_9HELO|nr:hypothetical protein BOTCAL_0098g00110 [Botryotinia calthae]